MNLLRSSITFLILMTSSGAQSPYNTISHGIIFDERIATSLSQGSVGLIPSYNSKFSEVNPATWSDLTFARLLAHYNAGEIEYPNQEFKSSFGYLTNATFIVPINGKFALGLGVRPVTRKRFSVKQGADAIFIFSGDTLIQSKQITGTGGVSSFFTGGSWKIDEANTLGLRMDFLFGVFDETTRSLSSFYRRHFEYKGTLLSLYLRAAQFETSLKSTLYVGFSVPFGRRKIVETDYWNLYDGGQKKSLQGFPLPYSISGAVVSHVQKTTHFGLEVLIRRFPKDDTSVLNTLHGGEDTAYRVSLGILREAIPGSRSLFERFHYRIGFFRRQHYIFRFHEGLKEQGIAFGFGIPFGVSQNQIDIGFQFSRRNGFLSDETEYVQQLTIGLSLGDIWLVKRRRR